jgi:hypothetical protein
MDTVAASTVVDQDKTNSVVAMSSLLNGDRYMTGSLNVFVDYSRDNPI